MKKDEIRNKLIETASRLFREKGFNATGVNQLVAEASVSRSSFYEHFDSKLELLLAYLDVFHQRWYESLLQYLYSMNDPKQRLLGLFEFRIYYQEKYLFPGCPFTRINAELGLHNDLLSNKVREGKTYFREFILEMVKNTDHKRKLKDEELADLIFLLIEGGLSSAAFNRSTVDLKKGKQLLSTFL